MQGNRGSAVVIVAIVLVLMMGTLYMYMFSESQREPDPREDSHGYVAEAVIEGVAYIGEGSSVYTPENGNYHTYMFTFELTDGTDTRSMSFGMVFGSDDRPDPTIYTYVGPGDPERDEIGVWTMVDGGTTYTFHVSEHCTVTSLAVSSEGFEMTAELA